MSLEYATGDIFNRFNSRLEGESGIFINLAGPVPQLFVCIEDGNVEVGIGSRR